MTAAEQIIDKLTAAGCTPRQAGGAWSARCPAHEDSNPSLSVRDINGQALLFCHAGCDTASVLASLQLTMRDLYDNPKGSEYRYPDGRIVHRTPEKRFFQTNVPTGTASLYRADMVAAAIEDDKRIYVVEGEKDVLALESVGLVATCSPMGAGKWSKVDPKPLYGGKVVVVADNDEPGRKHAADVLASLQGQVQSISVVRAKVGKDAADHVAAGHGPNDFEPVELPAATAGTTSRTVKVTWANTIEPLAVVWAWCDDCGGRISLGTLSLAAGREGTGKSSFGIWMTARVTTGTLPGMLFGTPRAVLYVAVEDSWRHTLVPRLMAAGADLTKVGRVEVTTTGDDELVLSLPDDLPELEKAITRNGVALVVLDPLLSMIGERIDTHRNREVREALDPLARLADRTGALLLGIAHFNKSSGTDAASLISGSGAFKDVPRSVFGFARDDEGRVMTQVKNSLGRDDLPSLTYDITSAEVPVKGGTAEVGRFTFTGESDRSVSDVLRDARGDDEGKAERNEAAEWLLGYLTEDGGQAPAAEVIKAAKAAGYNESTIKKTRARMKVTSTRIGFGKQAHYSWSLPHGIPMESMQSSNQTVDSMDSMTDSMPDPDPSTPGTPSCSMCGRANLYAPISIARGVCAACTIAAERSAS